MQITEFSVFGLRSSIVDLRTPNSPLRFRLFPMVHIGNPEYYRDVTRRLSECDLVVAEGTDNASSLGFAVVLAMRLTGRRAAWSLVHQDIDYAVLGKPTAWPEGSGTPRRSWWRSAAGWLDVLLMTPFYTVVMVAGGRDWLLRQHYVVNDNTEVRARFRSKDVVDARDRVLLDALAGIYAERKDRREVVGIAYGAGHMPAVVRELRREFGYRPVGAEWVTVFDDANLHVRF